MIFLPLPQVFGDHTGARIGRTAVPTIDRDGVSIHYETHGAGPPLLILLARKPRHVGVMATASRTVKKPLVVQPAHDRHVGRVRTRLLGLAIERVHHELDRGLALAPDLLHDLRLELVQGRWWS